MEERKLTATWGQQHKSNSNHTEKRRGTHKLKTLGRCYIQSLVYDPFKSIRLAEPQRTSQTRAFEGVQTLRGTKEMQGLTEVLRTAAAKSKPSATSALK